MRSRPVMFAALLLGTAGAAHANATMVPAIGLVAPPAFAQLDADGDGAIAREESDAPLAAKFASYDLDRDGRLSQAEFEDYVLAEFDPGLAQGADAEEDD